MNQLITIVTAIPDDVCEIRHVQKIAWLATYPNEEVGITTKDIADKFTEDDTESGRAKLEERKRNFHKPDQHIVVAKLNSQVIGFCIVTKESHEARVGAVYVLPEHHSQGIGGKLIQAGLSWLGKQSEIYVNVASYNQKAINFYEKFGFVRTGKAVQDTVASLPSGKVIPEIEMVKKNVPIS